MCTNQFDFSSGKALYRLAARFDVLCLTPFSGLDRTYPTLIEEKWHPRLYTTDSASTRKFLVSNLNEREAGREGEGMYTIDSAYNENP